MNEFQLIQDYIKPLAGEDEAALGLSDDAAILPAPHGGHYVLTKDTIAEEIHYLKGTTPELIAKKLLRVNISDLCAMGAKPAYYLLSMTLAEGTDQTWIKAFFDAFKEDCTAYGGTLIGGDTVKGNTHSVFSLTAIGTVEPNKLLTRSRCRAGDLIAVTGTIGDGFLGLHYLKDKEHYAYLSKEEQEHIEQAYHLPTPPTKLSTSLSHIAHGAIDISDGLVQDLGHLCAQNHCSAEINAEQTPLSKAAQNALKNGHTIQELLTGGDDYQLLFTIAKKDKDVITGLATMMNTKVTIIGQMNEGSGVCVVDGSGNELTIDKTGFEHQF